MTFRELHFADEPLLLPNAWDVGSALAFAAAGFPAIGTTSFGVNASAGRPDAEGASRDATVALVRAITGLPAYITVDIEDGFSDDPAEVAMIVDRGEDFDPGDVGQAIDDLRAIYRTIAIERPG